MTALNGSPDAGHVAVLIADIDEAICFALARMVRRLGLVPLVAADGRQAVEMACSYSGSIVAAVLDLQLPQTDAQAFVAQLADARLGFSVILTGANHAALAEARHTPGVRTVLEKPFELSVFMSCLTAFLDEAALRAG